MVVIRDKSIILHLKLRTVHMSSIKFTMYIELRTHVRCGTWLWTILYSRPCPSAYRINDCPQIQDCDNSLWLPSNLAIAQASVNVWTTPEIHARKIPSQSTCLFTDILGRLSRTNFGLIASVTTVTICSGNDLLPFWYQAITSTNVGLFEPFGKTVNDILIQKRFMGQNASAYFLIYFIHVSSF